MAAPAKRLIEVSLPLEAISAQSAREKSIRHGHISTLHIWWARRPLAAMRAAIFAALVPDPGNDAERKELEDLIAAMVDWDQVKAGNGPAIEKAKAIIRRHYPDAPPKLLDPFMGGGSTGLEALRLGCETYAVELNPVAHLIELCTLVYPQKYGQPEKRLVRQGNVDVEQTVNPLAEDVRKWGQWVLDRAREEIGHLYENPVGDETIVGYLWARTVKCPNPACGAEMPLVRQWWLAKTAKRKIAVRPNVDHAAKRVSFEVVDLGGKDRAADGFDPSEGTTIGGNGHCLLCGQVAEVAYIREQASSGQMKQTLMAVIEDQTAAGKRYRPGTPRDQVLFERAQVDLEPRLDEVPDEPLPPIGTLGFRVQRYGLTRWGDLFNGSCCDRSPLLQLSTVCRSQRLLLCLAETCNCGTPSSRLPDPSHSEVGRDHPGAV